MKLTMTNCNYLSSSGVRIAQHASLVNSADRRKDRTQIRTRYHGKLNDGLRILQKSSNYYIPSPELHMITQNRSWMYSFTKNILFFNSEI